VTARMRKLFEISTWSAGISLARPSTSVLQVLQPLPAGLGHQRLGGVSAGRYASAVDVSVYRRRSSRFPHHGWKGFLTCGMDIIIFLLG
jgi:hypothetical protein